MIWKNNGKMFWPGWNSFSECMTSFCREGPNAGKPGPCPDPEKAKRRAEIKAGKVKVEPKKIEAAAIPAKKEPWEMTRAEHGKREVDVGNDALIALSKKVSDVKDRRDWSKIPSSFQDDAVRKLKTDLQPHFRGAANNQIQARVALSSARTFDEIQSAVSKLNSSHRSSVESALSAGKPVQPEVLKNYPDVAAKAPKPAKTKPKPPGLFDGKDTPPSAEYLRLKAMRLKHAATGSMYVERPQ